MKENGRPNDNKRQQANANNIIINQNSLYMIVNMNMNIMSNNYNFFPVRYTYYVLL